MEQLLQNKKILVIDDDKALCQNLEIGLSRQGALVASANNGQSGLKKFYEMQPDLVILDLRMPEMDGWETCRLIRLVAQTPIIMLTSVAQEHEVVRGLRKGADDYVTKPFCLRGCKSSCGEGAPATPPLSRPVLSVSICCITRLGSSTNT